MLSRIGGIKNSIKPAILEMIKLNFCSFYNQIYIGVKIQQVYKC